MKLLISISLILISISASSQKMDDFYNGEIYKHRFDSFLKKTFKIGLQPSGGWHYLQQDHMPCYVPDTNEVSKIRNLWNGPVLVFRDGNMPNPALPQNNQDKKGK